MRFLAHFLGGGQFARRLAEKTFRGQPASAITQLFLPLCQKVETDAAMQVLFVSVLGDLGEFDEAAMGFDHRLEPITVPRLGIRNNQLPLTARFKKTPLLKQ